MKRSLVIAGTLLLILIAIGLGLTIYMDRIVKNGIETMGSDMLQVPVLVDDVTISLFSGEGTLSGISVLNPDEFEEGEAIALGSVEISMDPVSLLSDTIYIHDLVVRQLEIFFELQPAGSNLGQIQANLADYQEDREPMEQELVIDRILMDETTLTAQISLGEIDPMTLSLPEIEHTDIGREGSADLEVVIASLLDLVIQEVGGQTLEELIEGEGERLLDDARDALRERLQN